MATPTTTAKNNSKYNNCTLEYIELSTCTKLSLKLERETRPFLKLSGLQERTCLALWRNILSFSPHRVQGEENKIPMARTKKKRANQKCDFSEPSSFTFSFSLLKVQVYSFVKRHLLNYSTFSSSTICNSRVTDTLVRKKLSVAGADRCPQGNHEQYQSDCNAIFYGNKGKVEN